jgi:hypothetical protein
MSIGAILKAKCERLAEQCREAESQVAVNNKACYNMSLNNNNLKHDINHGIEGRKPVTKEQFHKLAKQLTDWGVWNSGRVIKNEGPQFVRKAVFITQNATDIKTTPGQYFYDKLRKLQGGEI